MKKITWNNILKTFDVLLFDGTKKTLSTPETKKIAITILNSGSGTYSVPSGISYLRVRMVGGGGGGSGSGTSAGAGGAGGNTTFGSLTAYGALGTTQGSTYVLGGSASGGDINIKGQNGSVTVYGAAPSMLGEGGHGSSTGAGIAGGVGAGGGGGYLASPSGTGGAAGGYCEKIITNTSPQYSYAVGAGGSAGTPGGGGYAGGAGGSGIIIIEEYYY